MTKRILHLTLKKEWFNKIASGEKKEEYREVKSYWVKRLFHWCPTHHNVEKQFDEIHFRNGYNRNSPFMRVKWKGIEPKIILGKKYFAIQLGKILEIRNWKWK